MLTRTVKINAMGVDDMTEFLMTVGDAEFQRALGYLMSWAFPGQGTFTEAKIDITYSKSWGPEMLATYSGEPGRGYTIGAIWREDEKRFSFHS